MGILLGACSKAPEFKDDVAYGEGVLLEEMQSPNAVFIDMTEESEQFISTQAFPPNARILHKHTFSNGETLEYETMGGSVLADDMELMTVTELEAVFNEYEQTLNSTEQSPLESQAASAATVCKNPDTSPMYAIACAMGNHLWPNGIVYYEPPSPSVYDKAERDQIAAAISYVDRNTDLTFRSATSGDRIKFVHTVGKGCASYVGQQGGVQAVTLEKGGHCFSKPNGFGFDGSIAHELLHAVGFIHEHQRPDRDSYVTVTSTDSVNYGRYPRAFRVTDYDFGSIMHYSLSSRIVRKNFCCYTGEVGQRDRLSTLDIELINSIY